MFLFRVFNPHRRGEVAVVADEGLRVQYADRHRVKRDLGFAREVEKVGVNKGKLTLHAVEGRTARGFKLPTSYAYLSLDLKAEKAKDKIRRLRDQEAAPIKRVDDAIAELQGRIEAFRVEREQLVKEAFRKGNAVTKAELVERAEERERARAEA